MYIIYFECGLGYIGQTKRHLSDQLTEHKHSVKIKEPYSDLTKPVIEGNKCVPLWQSTSLILTERDGYSVVSHYHNHTNAGNSPTLSLDTKLKWFLQVWSFCFVSPGCGGEMIRVQPNFFCYLLMLCARSFESWSVSAKSVLTFFFCFFRIRMVEKPVINTNFREIKFSCVWDFACCVVLRVFPSLRGFVLNYVKASPVRLRPNFLFGNLHFLRSQTLKELFLCKDRR